MTNESRAEKGAIPLRGKRIKSIHDERGGGRSLMVAVAPEVV